MYPSGLTYVNRTQPAILLVPLILHNTTLAQHPYLLQIQRKFQSRAFTLIIDDYLNRYYETGYLDIQSASEWANQYIPTWLDKIEADIYWELEEPPDTNVQMATDILYVLDMHPQVLNHLVSDMIQTANETILPYIDTFLEDLRQLNVGCETSLIEITPHETVNVRFKIVTLDFIELWKTDNPPYRGERFYALI